MRVVGGAAAASLLGSFWPPSEKSESAWENLASELREREIYLTPDSLGCRHRAADTAEPSECSMSVRLSGGDK